MIGIARDGPKFSTKYMNLRKIVSLMSWLCLVGLHVCVLLIICVDWNDILPQLEEIIRQTREEKRIRNVCDEVKDFFSSDEGEHCFCPIRSLKDLPTVVAFVTAEGSETTVSGQLSVLVKREMREFGMRSTREIFEVYGIRMLAVFAECNVPIEIGLAEQAEQSMSSDLPDFTPVILQHCCAFFKSELNPMPRSFRSIWVSNQITIRKSYKEGRYFDDLYAVEGHQPDLPATRIATRLARKLDIMHLTMEELRKQGAIFVCIQCTPILREKMDWERLVGVS